MKGARPGILLCGLVSALVGSARAQQMPPERYAAEVELRRWQPTLVSDWEFGAAAPPIFPPADLGLGDERFIETRAVVRLARRLKIRGSRYRADYQGSIALERELAFDELRLPPGTAVETELELEYWKAGVEIDLLSGRDGFLAVVADYSRLESRARLDAAAAPDLALGPTRLVLPLLGLKARAYLTPSFSVSAEAAGMRTGGEAEERVTTDLEAVATYHFGRNVSLSFGYRNFYGKRDEELERLVYRLRGRFVSIALRI